jgi:hypothetical protein
MALWDSFAEAARDIVKATLRGRIVDLPPTLPERLAAREKTWRRISKCSGSGGRRFNPSTPA